MIVNTARRVLVLLALLISSNAYCFIDPPTFAPTNPTAGQEVLINVRFGVCDGYLSAPPTITYSDTDIEIIYQTATSGFCNIPIATLTTSLGALAAGNYSIVIKRNNTVLGSPPVLSLVGTYILQVQQAAAAMPVPTLAPGFMLSLILTLLLIVATMRKRNISALALIFLVGSYSATVTAAEEGNIEIRSVQLLLSVESGAPTSDDVLRFVADPSNGEPPLEAFRTARPESASYLLPARVEPALARLLGIV